MANFSSVVLLFLLTAASTISTASTTVDDISSSTTSQELEITLEALRNRGYTLFPNAITTSDLRFQLLATVSAAEPTSQFTLFAPRNAPLFALDMASDASSYVSTLRYHVIPFRRLTFSDLQNFSSPFLDTLLPHYSVLIGQILDTTVSPNNRSSSIGVMVDGVRVSEPDLFLGSRFAVHGIDGILVTGLDIHHQDFDNNGSGFLSPLEAPATSSGGLDWNIPADGTPSPTPGIYRNNVPVPPPSHPVRNIPVAAPPAASHPVRNIPAAEGTPSPTPGFHWNNVPFPPPSQTVGSIPVAAPPTTPPGRAENVKNMGKKKQGKRRRKGGIHRRHRRRVDHRLVDL